MGGCDVTTTTSTGIASTTAKTTTAHPSTTTTPTVNTDLTCPQNDDYEPNDSYLEAAAISNDGTFVSGVLCGKEFDVFAVDVCEGGEVTADLVLAAVSVDKVNLVLLDEAGKIVDKTKLRAGDLAASLTVSVDSGGEYYVRVVGRDDDLETQYSVAATVSGCDVTPQVGSTAEGTTSTTTTPTVNTDLTCPQNDDYEPND